jgi:hypothetical protein
MPGIAGESGPAAGTDAGATRRITSTALSPDHRRMLVQGHQERPVVLAGSALGGFTLHARLPYRRAAAVQPSATRKGSPEFARWIGDKRRRWILAGWLCGWPGSRSTASCSACGCRFRGKAVHRVSLPGGQEAFFEAMSMRWVCSAGFRPGRSAPPPTRATGGPSFARIKNRLPEV